MEKMGRSWHNGYYRRKCSQLQILDMVVFISQNIDTPEKGVNPTILSSYEYTLGW